MLHAVFDVEFKVPPLRASCRAVVPADAVVGAAGMRQPVWQFAARELHDIMQFVTVEVIGVGSPWKGGVTFGVVRWKGLVKFGVVACPSAASCAKK
jgi:hypothetical protein